METEAVGETQGTVEWESDCKHGCKTARSRGAQETARSLVPKGPWDGEMVVREEHCKGRLRTQEVLLRSHCLLGTQA